jgi:hypothetical protein
VAHNIDWPSWINAALVFALVVITAYYARSTANILDESRKAREATERQASAAEESIRALRQRWEEEAGLSRTIVATAIQTATRNIEYWKNRNIQNLAATNGLPATVDLLPTEHHSAIQHARRISVDASVELSGVFDNLRLAKTEIEILRDARETSVAFYAEHSRFALEFLDAAKIDLDKAQEYLQQAIKKDRIT